MTDSPHSLAQQRCFHHSTREAVACCLECGRYYCRECVTEHGGRLLCAQCISGLSKASSAPEKRHLLRALRAPIQFLIALLILWTCFFVAGRLMILTPSEFHETNDYFWITD